MDDLAGVPAPVYLATLIATLVPFVTALLVRYHASSAWKSATAMVLSLLDAWLVTWKAADDAGVAVDLRVLSVAFAGALGWQRVIHTQVNVPWRIAEKRIPKAGLVGAPPRL